ncbi:MAG: histidine kinase [Ilumatobacteraceae bacterium]|nr:histidine kinase [Ilumatobacteraceae bacterium]
MSLETRAAVLWERIGPRTRDIVIMAIALLATAADVLARRHTYGLEPSIAMVGGLAGTVALWWRRKHPVTVTLVGMVVFALPSHPVTLVFGLFSIAVRARDRVLVLMTILSAATFALVEGVGNGAGWLALSVSGVLQAGFCAAAGSYVGARRDLVMSLRERADRAEAERELRAEQARLGERARIAREMHDVLAHKVSLVALHAGALEINDSLDAARIHETAGLIRRTAHEAMEDLREVLGVLRSEAGADAPTDRIAGDRADLTPAPHVADIARVVDDSRAAGLHAELSMEVADMPDALARTAYRVVQEGLTNVHKHARGASTSIRVAGDAAQGVTVDVVNCRPVASGSLLPGSGNGLIGLRERVSLLGGTLQSGPSPDGGWHLAAWLPWTPPAPAATRR